MARTKKKPQPSRAFKPRFAVSHQPMRVDGSDEVFRHVLYLMVLASARLATFREAVGRMIGLTGSQYLVLLATAHRQGGEGVTIRELAQYVLMASTHVTTQVGALIRKGLLKKRPHGHDGRSVLVSLTAKGERAMNSIAPVRCEFNDAFFVDIDRATLLTVAQFLQQVAQNSERALPLLDRLEQQLARTNANRPAP
jgi:DNA-binding MarR family transcriptional regulator